MKKNLFLTVILFLCVTVFSTPVSAGLEGSVSQTVIPEGESFNLYLRQDGNAEQPDISVLNEDFLIVGQRKSYKSSNINGKIQTFNENVLTLIPKKTGEVVLPSIRAGKEKTSAITLTVVPGGQAVPAGQSSSDGRQENSGANAAVRPGVFIRSQALDKTPYVFQQVPYVIKLYASVKTPLLDGAVTPPLADGVVSEQWGDPKRSQETVNGETFDVLEYRFLLFPQRSGSITLSPARFQGIVSDPGASPDLMADDFFGFSSRGGFSSFFSQKNVAVQSQEVVLDVRPKPASAGRIWLPATDVALSEDITPPKSDVALGEALTRTITLMVSGVRDSQIPDPSFADGSGYRQYPGRTDSKNLFDNKGIVGVKTRQIVFMPTKTGQMVLPALEIPWFDVKTNRMKTAVLPPRTINVAAGDASVAAEPHDLTPPSGKSSGVSGMPVVSDTAKAPVSSGVSSAPSSGESEFAKAFMPQDDTAEEKAAASVWGRHFNQAPERLFFAGILAGAAAMLVLWFLMNRLMFRKSAFAVKGAGKDADVSRRRAVGLLKAACHADNPAAAKDALMKVGEAFWPDNPPRTLSDAAGRFADDALFVEIENLNEALYGRTDRHWSGRGLWEVFKATKVYGKQGAAQEKTPVPPLYPN